MLRCTLQTDSPTATLAAAVMHSLCEKEPGRSQQAQTSCMALQPACLNLLQLRPPAIHTGPQNCALCSCSCCLLLSTAGDVTEQWRQTPHPCCCACSCRCYFSCCMPLLLQLSALSQSTTAQHTAVTALLAGRTLPQQQRHPSDLQTDPPGHRQCASGTMLIPLPCG